MVIVLVTTKENHCVLILPRELDVSISAIDLPISTYPVNAETHTLSELTGHF